MLTHVENERLGVKCIVAACFLFLAFLPAKAAPASATAERKLLYVAVPGIRNYLEYGGHGILVFDIDRGHKFVRRIPSAGVDEKGQPLNVKGIAASADT